MLNLPTGDAQLDVSIEGNEGTTSIMAHFQHRHALSVPGKFYVDILCLDCTVCREMAPAIFASDDIHHVSYVRKQPSTPEELALSEECMDRCPCNAIGEDGDLHDWSRARESEAAVPETVPAGPSTPERREKPIWKFW